MGGYQVHTERIRVSNMATQPAVPGMTASGLRWRAVCAGGRCSIDVNPTD